MLRRNAQRKHGTTRWSLRRRWCDAERGHFVLADEVKSECAGEWGAWGRLSDDGWDSITRPERGPLGKGDESRLNGGASAHLARLDSVRGYGV
jgi:hypothetical protein